MAEKHRKRSCQPRVERNVRDAEPPWSCSARGKTPAGVPGARSRAAARYSAWRYQLPALAPVSPGSGRVSQGWGGDGPAAVPSVWGWNKWVQGRMQPGSSCLCKSSAAQPCLVLCSTASACSATRAAAASFCEKRKLPAWSEEGGGMLQSIQGLQHHYWGVSLEIPFSGSA